MKSHFHYRVIWMHYMQISGAVEGILGEKHILGAATISQYLICEHNSQLQTLRYFLPSNLGETHLTWNGTLVPKWLTQAPNYHVCQCKTTGFTSKRIKMNILLKPHVPMLKQQVHLRIFHKIKTGETYPNSFYQATVSLKPKLHKDQVKKELQTNFSHEHRCKNLKI